MKTAEVTTHGTTQSVHLPSDIHLSGTEVFVKMVGKSVLLIPKDADPWQIMRDSLDEFTPDFMADRQQPAEQQRESPFE